MKTPRYPVGRKAGRSGVLQPWRLDVLLGVPRDDVRYHDDPAFDPFWEFDAVPEPTPPTPSERAQILKQVIVEAERRGLPRPVKAEWMAAAAFDAGTDWALVSAALHGTPLPEWARQDWTPARLAALGREIRRRMADGNSHR